MMSKKRIFKTISILLALVLLVELVAKGLFAGGHCVGPVFCVFDVDSVRKDVGRDIGIRKLAEGRLVQFGLVLLERCGSKEMHGFGNEPVPRKSVIEGKIRWAVNRPCKGFARGVLVGLVQPADNLRYFAAQGHLAQLHLGLPVNLTKV